MNNFLGAKAKNQEKALEKQLKHKYRDHKGRVICPKWKEKSKRSDHVNPTSQKGQGELYLTLAEFCK